MTIKKNLPDFFINAFYESKFRDQLFIIKASGGVIENENALDNLMADIRKLTVHGIKIILIYGGGAAMDKAVEARGIGIKKKDGRRVTDRNTINLMKEIVGGDLSLRVYQSMYRNNLDGMSFNAVPADWMNISLRPKEPVDFGFVGDIHDVSTRPIARQLKITNFIATPCMAMSNEGEICNINADTIATHLAAGLKANKLVFLSDVDGVQINGKTAFLITAEEIKGLIDDGTVTDGMKVKMENCQLALDADVKRIHLINGMRENALYKEIFESVGPGTMLLRDTERENYMNEIEVQKTIEGK